VSHHLHNRKSLHNFLFVAIHRLKQHLYLKPVGSYRFPIFLFALSMFIFAVFSSPYTNLQCLNADSDTQPHQYCHKATIKVTNLGNTLYNYPVRATIPYEAWFTNDYVDKSHSTSRDTAKAWDLKAYKSTLSNEVEIIGQDIRDMNTGEMQFWFVVPEIPNQDTSFTLLMSNAEQKRNQGIYFNGASYNGFADTFTVNDNNNIDLVSNYEVSMEIKMLDETNFTDTIILDKYDGVLGSGTGYAIRLTPLAGAPATMQVSCYSDNAVANTTYTYGVAGYQEIKMTHNGTAIQCHAGSNSSALVAANATNTNIKNLVVGGTNSNPTYQTMLYDLKIATGNTIQARYGFDAFSLDETDPICPYAAVIRDYSGNNNLGTYSTHSCQTNLSTSVGNVTLTAASDIPDIPTGYTGWSPNFFGDGNPFATPVAKEGQIGSEYYTQPSGFGVPNNFWYAMIFTPVGLILGGLVFIASRSLLMAIVASGMPVLFALSQGFLPIWYGIVWLMVVLISSGIKQFGEQW